jgi:hypothetical protein
MKTALILLPAWSIQNLPLGLATVATRFRDCGYPVEVFDLNIRCWRQCSRRYGNMWKSGHRFYWDDQSRSSLWEGEGCGSSKKLAPELIDHLDRAVAPILDGSFELFAFSLFEGNIQSTFHIVQCIRKKLPDARMIFGGPSAADIFLKSGNADSIVGQWLTEKDCAIPGEAEKVLADLLLWWKNGTGDPPDGVVTYHNASIRYHPPVSGNCWENLEIDYSGFDLAHYSQRVIPVEITRGCTRKCAYCSEKILHTGYRVKSIDRLMSMFRTCIEKRKCRWFSFAGSNINGDFTFFTNLLTRILSSGISLGWGGSIILHNRLDTQTIRAMARSGCTYVNTGLESASPAVLEKMNKPVDIECAVRILRDLRAARIDAAVNLIAGFPGETEADHQLTLGFIRKNGKFIKRIHVSPCRIFNDTALSLFPQRFGIEFQPGGGPDDWVSNDGENTLITRQRRVREIIRESVENRIQWLAPFEKDLCMRRNF